jgi:2-C-methyl-D-erythritol 2,4-cyclodiphosphate synthase
MRIGYGWDSHEFKTGIPLKLGGIKIPHNKGLAGHSDGDVLLHALTDALLGAIAAGDIGTHFPPSDPKWKGTDSSSFVKEAVRLVQQAGYFVANVDSTLILSHPKIVPFAAKIQARISGLLTIPDTAVGIKAKTPEGMGTDNAAIAHVVVLLLKKGPGEQRKAEALEAVPQPEIDQVVDRVLKEVPDTPKIKARR